MEQIRKPILTRLYNDVFKVAVLNASKTEFLYAKCIRYLARWRPVFAKLLSKPLQRVINKSYLIENQVGRFSICFANDSLGKSSPYFEYLSHQTLANNRNTLFVDIGSNIGFYSIIAMNVYSYQKVIAFEPNPDVYQVLVTNVDLNHLNKQVTTYNMALGEQSQTLAFGKHRVFTGRSRFLPSDVDLSQYPSEEYQIVNIATEPFDEFSQREGIDPSDISFIKIDVEGFEYQVLKGMEKTLQVTDQLRILVEIWEQSDNYQNILELLSNAGFVLEKKISRNFLFEKGMH